jgi:hypothetical protein
VTLARSRPEVWHHDRCGNRSAATRGSNPGRGPTGPLRLQRIAMRRGPIHYPDPSLPT